MAKRKKIKLGLFDILFLAIAGAGFVFALIGILINWFSNDISGSVKLFSDSGIRDFIDEKLTEADVSPIGVIRAFAIIAVVLSGLCAVGVALKAFDVVRIKGLLPFLFAGATIAVGILVAVFSYVYAGDVSVGSESIKVSTTVPSVGMYFCAIGTIAGGAAMLLKRG